MKKTAIVIEDQVILWDFIKHSLEQYYEVKAFASNSKDAVADFRKYNPDLVWLDCYLGEINEANLGLKNSGLELATWIKHHKPECKIFLFTASYEASIYKAAKELKLEGLGLGAKFLKDTKLVQEGIEQLALGQTWESPNIINELNLEELGKLTIFEYSVILGMILGKSTAQIAEELDTTRKFVNNVLYKMKIKFNLDDDYSREDILEFLRNKFNIQEQINSYYSLPELLAINAMGQNILGPLAAQIRNGKLRRVTLNQIAQLRD